MFYKIASVFVILCIILVSVRAQDASSSTTKVHISTNITPNITAPTPEPTTSTPKPTPSTPKPTTSTPKPTPSTPKPTTSTPKPTTSTPKPTTSTTEPTTSTPKPTPSTPKPTTSTPKPTTSTPKPTPSTPKPTTSTPKPTTSTPKPTTSTPKPTPSTPKPTTSTPEPTTSTPKPTPSTPKPTTSTPKPTTSTPKPTTSTPKPTTSTPKPTTSTPKPTTSTPKPTTSTPKPTTPTPKPTTSTPKPTTSTPKPATSTPKPTTPTQSTSNVSTGSTQLPTSPTFPPSPESPSNPWNVTNPSMNNSACIFAEFAATLRIRYNTSDGHSVWTIGFNIPSNASVDEKESNCNISDTQVLVLNFDDQNQTMGSITLTFNKTNDNIFVESVKLTYLLTEELFPKYINPKDYNRMITAVNNSLTLFSVSKSNSYKCDSQTSATLRNNDESLEIDSTELDITKAKVQAYIQADSQHYSEENICDADKKGVEDITTTIPIIVGSTLAVLILIVLIAFFIGKRRIARISYAQM